MEIYNLVDLYKALGVYREDLTGDEIVDIFFEKGIVRYFMPKEDEEGNKHSRKLAEVDGIEFALGIENNYKMDYGDEFIDKLNMNHIGKMIRECHAHSIALGRIRDVASRVKMATIVIDVPKENDPNSESMCRAMLIFLLGKTTQSEIGKAMDKLKLDDFETYSEVMKGNIALKVRFTVGGRMINVYKPTQIKSTKGLVTTVDIQKVLYGTIYEFFSAPQYKNVFASVDSESSNITYMGMYSTYEWAIDNIYLGLEVYNKTQVKGMTEEEIKEIHKQTVVDKLKLNKGDICLFSVGKFKDTAQDIGEVEYLTVKENGKLIDKRFKKRRYMKLLGNQSFALSRVYDITDDYLVLEVSYASSSDVVSRLVPVKWNLFFPESKKYIPDSTGKQRHMDLVARFQRDINLDNVYNFVGDSLVLMTVENCMSLKHPTVRAIPSTSLK